MSWQFYLSPDGRVTRAQWWQKLFLPIFGAIVLTMILDAVLGWRPRQSPIGILTILVSWLTIYPTVVVSVKRLHDHNKSGWWYLMYLIPLVGWIWLIIECGCLRGTVGDNRYGPDLLPFQDSSARSLLRLKLGSAISPNKRGRAAPPTPFHCGCGQPQLQ